MLPELSRTLPSSHESVHEPFYDEPFHDESLPESNENVRKVREKLQERQKAEQFSGWGLGRFQ